MSSDLRKYWEYQRQLKSSYYQYQQRKINEQIMRQRLNSMLMSVRNQKFPLKKDFRSDVFKIFRKL